MGGGERGLSSKKRPVTLSEASCSVTRTPRKPCAEPVPTAMPSSLLENDSLSPRKFNNEKYSLTETWQKEASFLSMTWILQIEWAWRLATNPEAGLNAVATSSPNGVHILEDLRHSVVLSSGQ
ncbi:uncharacterized protein LOC101967419 isoform X2 [Ictidomys tridecemlineatus]